MGSAVEGSSRPQMVAIPATTRKEAASVTTATRAPFYTLADRGDALSLLIELPGADARKIVLEISAKELRVHAGLVVLAEDSLGAYAGALHLPTQVEPEKTSARYGEGVLVVTMRRIPALVMHKVKIDVDHRGH